MNKVKENCICYIDCRIDNRLSNDFLTLNIWGKPVYSYSIEAAQQADVFNRIIVVTDSLKIQRGVRERNGIEIQTAFDEKINSKCICVLSGRAPLINSMTLKRAYEMFTGGVLYTNKDSVECDFSNVYSNISFYKKEVLQYINAFSFCGIGREKSNEGKQTFFKLDDCEAVVINSINDFELAVVLKKKELNKGILKENILTRIKEKTNELLGTFNNHSICLVGHSQLDLWPINKLAGLRVRNCGVSGISSFEYYDYILSRNLLNCSADAFIVMHGTNDIVLEYGIDEIADSIYRTINYIKSNNKSAFIYFISCIHVNGRLDRNNHRIDQLNVALHKKLEKEVTWIDTSCMDDEFGDLKINYTIDGLHLSDSGYQVLKKLVEDTMAKENLETI